MEVPVPRRRTRSISCCAPIVTRPLAARRFFEKAIDKNGEPEMITADKSGANWAALESLNAERSTPIKDR